MLFSVQIGAVDFSNYAYTKINQVTRCYALLIASYSIVQQSHLQRGQREFPLFHQPNSKQPPPR